MYVKDYTNYNSNQFVRMILCDTVADKGTGFFRGIKPEDVLKKRDAFEKVKQTIDNLVKFNVWMETLVSVTDNGYFVIKDTQVNEY
jgi:hypothetical protein